MTDPLAWLTELEGVRSAYAGTRDGIDVMLRDRGLRRTSPEMTAESLLRGAHASAVLEGSSASIEQVREGAGDEIATDAVRLSASMLALAWAPRSRDSAVVSGDVRRSPRSRSITSMPSRVPA